MNEFLFLRDWTHDTYHRRVKYRGGKVHVLTEDVATAALEAGVVVPHEPQGALGEPEPSLDHPAPEMGDGMSTLIVD